MAIKSGVTIKAPKSFRGLSEVSDVVRMIASVEVLVGVPEETTDMRNEDGQEYITNASLAHIHDQGAPEARIPARPFMRPGIDKVKDKISKKLRRIAAVGLETRDLHQVEAMFHEVGLTAQLAIQNTIQEGIPPPLADSTLRGRARKSKQRSKQIAAAHAKAKAKKGKK